MFSQVCLLTKRTIIFVLALRARLRIQKVPAALVDEALRVLQDGLEDGLPVEVDLVLVELDVHGLEPLPHVVEAGRGHRVDAQHIPRQVLHSHG